MANSYLERHLFWVFLGGLIFSISLLLIYLYGSPNTDMVGGLFTWIAKVINKIGLLGIFFIMLLEYIIAPIPSELVLPFSGWLIAQEQFSLFSIIIATTIASYIGSMILYYLGEKGGRTFIEKYGKYILVDQQDLQSAENLFEQYGNIIIFAGRMLPGIRTIVSFPAGLAYMDKARFSLYTLAGSLIWNCSLIGIGMLLRENWIRVSQIISQIEIPILLTAGIFLLWFIYNKMIRNRNKENHS